MGARLRKLLKLMVWLVAGAAIAFLGVRVYDSQRGAPLESLAHLRPP